MDSMPLGAFALFYDRPPEISVPSDTSQIATFGSIGNKEFMLIEPGNWRITKCCPHAEGGELL
jgi:hypothetical protein